MTSPSPFALNDPFYHSGVGQKLVADGSAFDGVLANDYHPRNSTLTATLLQDVNPAHGDLTFN